MGWTIPDCSPRAARTLAAELGVSETTASVLLRRGYRDAGAARAFLEGAQPAHDPLLLGDMAAACDALRRALRAGKRICVHGDYDADGICATALAVLVLRELGGDVDWHLPTRFEEGYGVTGGTIARLAQDGCGLLLTVDCGITAVAEIAQAKALGVEVVVTDHHRPGPALPACPLVVTRPSEYPFPHLSGTGVVYKLLQTLAGDDRVSRHLDLVGLATIADVVPLVDENRFLAREGLRMLARSQKPGLQALMRSARVDPATVDEGAVGFRLAPRINAAGRLCRPEAALELLLTDEPEVASRLADQLEGLNRERQAVEERILREALAAVDAWPESRRRRRGYVLASEEWHEGVIGIVAARLVERFHRPVVLIAGGDPEWKGSGRSPAAFDLHAGLAACAEQLERFGGHRAAAGLSIRPERVGEFAAAFADHVDQALDEADLQPRTSVDAIVPASRLTLDLCAELQRLAPFGLGNPNVTLLVAGCELGDLAAVGEGRHLRFRVRQSGRDAASAIAFGLGPQLDVFRRGGAYDVAFRLEENRWNGTVAPQLVVKRIFESAEGYAELRQRLRTFWRAGPAAWPPEVRTIFDELELEPDADGKRELLESPTFRALLAEPELRRAA